MAPNWIVFSEGAEMSECDMAQARKGGRVLASGLFENEVNCRYENVCLSVCQKACKLNDCKVCLPKGRREVERQRGGGVDQPSKDYTQGRGQQTKRRQQCPVGARQCVCAGKCYGQLYEATFLGSVQTQAQTRLHSAIATTFQQ